MKKKLLMSIATFTILSSIGLGSHLITVHSDEQVFQGMKQISNQKEVVQFEDPTIEAAAKLELFMILGRPVTPEDMTQENLNKLTELVTLANVNIKTLNDLSKMPNLEIVSIFANTGTKILDASPLGTLSKLKEFNFWHAGAHLSSLKPLVGKPLKVLTMSSLPLVDDSEKELSKMTNLQTLQINYLENDKHVNIDHLDSLPQLKEITLTNLGLTTAPTLKASTQLEYASFSSNCITEVPELTQSNSLEILNMDRNSIVDYKNVDTVLALPNQPTIDMGHNLLTTYHAAIGQRKIDVQSNFILHHDLPFQYAIKKIETQNLHAGEQKEIPIEWVYEDQSPIVEDFTASQKELTDLKNMTIRTDNENVSIEKNSSNIVIKALDGVKGNTHVVLSYQGELKTEFDVVID